MTWSSTAKAISPARVDRVLSRAMVGKKVFPALPSEGANVTDEAVPYGWVTRYGAIGDGATNDTAAFTIARSIWGGRYHVPAGNYVLDASPDVWLDAFTAEGGATLTIAGTPYDVSNAFAGRLRWVAASNELTWLVDARTGDYVMGVQNNAGGRATYFRRGLSITSDSHALQLLPTGANDSIDVLLQRSAAHPTDPSGNRFSFTYDGANDRWLFSFATTASGFPAFDTWLEVGAGTAPYLAFRGLQPELNQGWSAKQRSSGGLHLEYSPSHDPSYHILRDKATPENICMTFGSGTVGFHGASPTGRLTVTGSRGGNAALASLLSQLASKGLITDSTTA